MQPTTKGTAERPIVDDTVAVDLAKLIEALAVTALEPLTAVGSLPRDVLFSGFAHLAGEVVAALEASRAA